MSQVNSPLGLRRTYIYHSEQFTALPSPSESRASATPALNERDDREQLKEVCESLQSRVDFKNIFRYFEGGDVIP